MEKQIDKHKLSFPVTFEKIGEIKNSDTRFTKLKCWLMHTGENLNYSSFSREVIENAIPTLAYIPVVGFLETNEIGEEDFSDHRYVVTKDYDGVKRKYCGSAYGVILSSEDNNAHFETKICDDGIEREFIVADAVAWNFLENSSQILNRDMIKDHSIELDENSIEGYEDEETGIFHFTNFSFRAACVLGNGVIPAMAGSVVEVVNFSLNDFAKDVQRELINKYSEFTKLVNDTASADIVDEKSFTEQNQVDEKNNQGGMVAMSNIDFAAKFEKISTMVGQHETFTDKFNAEKSRFEIVDVRDNEVIVVDKMNGYDCFGLSFTEDNGEEIEINFENAKKKKICFEDCTEGDVVHEGVFNFGKHINEIENSAYAKIEEANIKISEYETKVSEIEQLKSEVEANYTQIKSEYDEMKSKYDAYVQAEELRQMNELNAQKDAKFAEYESILGENADFIALKERKGEMSVDEIEKECAVIYVRENRAKLNFSISNQSSAIVGVLEDKDDSDDKYVDTKYGRIPVRK